MVDQPRNDRPTETRSSSLPGWLLALLVIVGLIIAAFALGLVNVDQISSGKAPGLKVETTAGEAPTFDVNTATVDLGQKEKTVKVPTIDVGSKDETVTVPTLDVEPAKDK
jgi:hypothetical protein